MIEVYLWLILMVSSLGQVNCCKVTVMTFITVWRLMTLDKARSSLTFNERWLDGAEDFLRYTRIKWKILWVSYIRDSQHHWYLLRKTKPRYVESRYTAFYSCRIVTSRPDGQRVRNASGSGSGSGSNRRLRAQVSIRQTIHFFRNRYSLDFFIPF